MFTTRIIDVKEKERFNNFVKQHPKGHFLQTWEWGEVKRGMGWEPLPLILEQDREIRGTLLILKRKLPLPGKRCIFYAPRGPVADINDFDLCQALFKGAERVARDYAAIFLKLDPDVPASGQHFRDILQQCNFRHNDTGLDFEGVQPVFVFQLDITPPAPRLLEQMHSKTRYNIKLAARKGVTVRKAAGKGELPLFYSILQETAVRDRFLIRGYEYFEMIWDQMVENKMAQVFLAEYEGRVIAATLVLVLGKKAWYLYGASSNDYRNVMPNYLIQWEMIRWAQERGCQIYDFRGVSGDLNEDNPLYGLYRFKKGFNGDLVEFIGDWDRVYAPVFYWGWTKFLPFYKQARRRLIKSSAKE
ncbi:MAG: peptidoglycan bridge formation glycyltransferase FemA/FemB family protein [Syntrophomonadaceae bacterium]|nr:peptidoglycan bridge formation glycyltransferase FemA/FemB family protein [Syntrophomonadaceae bacterium]